MRKPGAGGWILTTFIMLFIVFLPLQVFSMEVEKTGETFDYQVQSGDTLWDICQKQYQNPWVWPKLWEINPQVQNPHWIYPGDILKIYYQKPNGETASIPVPRIIFNYIGSNDINFVSTEEDECSMGLVVAGRGDNKVMLSQEDLIYVEFPESLKVHVGDCFQTFTPLESFEHPLTGKKFGYINKITGIIRIVENADTCYIAKVLRSFIEIQAGQKVRPLPVELSQINIVPGEKSVTGHIVFAENKLIGDHQMVYVDLGKKQGVRVGNYFEIIREEKVPERELVGKTRVFPPYKIGEMIILDVGQKSSTGYIVKARRTISIGEIVRLMTAEKLNQMVSSVPSTSY